jgi:predicted enzyme related to lactoylglutathione lyase
VAGEPAFFEIGVEDYEKGKAFYGALFGWEFTPGPNEGYEIGTAGLPGGMHGGDKGAAPYVFFLVDDMEAAMARVRELGGEVVDMGIEGDAEQQARTGRFKLCRDDQGSSFGLHQRPR